MAELRQFVGFMLAQEHYGIDIKALLICVAELFQ